MRQNTSTEVQRTNKPSQLLTQEESDQVFSLLGNKCQSLATAVVQVFKTEGTAHSHWKKKYTGVLCIVRDASKKGYFMRLYCLIRNELAWEHECYETIDVHKARPYLLTFEGQDGNVALNFALEDECGEVFRELQTIQNRNRRRIEKRNRLQLESTPGISSSQIENSRYKLQNNSPNISTNQLNQISNTLSSIKPKFSTSSKDKKKRKYTKDDISAPTNFVHLSHLGWDPNKGFDASGKEDDIMLKHFFLKAGVSNELLKDQETRDYIYQFVKENNVIETAKQSENQDKLEDESDTVNISPSVSNKHQNQNGSQIQRAAPPLPPTSQPVIKARQPPPPVPAPTATRAPPPLRPPPINVGNAPVQPPVAIPPPPPPPPLPQLLQQSHIESENERKPSSISNIPDVRSALMESIRKGTTLKHVDTPSLSTGSGDSRNELLSEIRHGVELRPVESRQLPSASSNAVQKDDENAFGIDALAHALRRALIDRGKFIQSSDDESDESSDNCPEWDD